MSNIFSFNRLSIQQRLTLLICSLLLSAIVIYGFANYYSLKKTTLIIGKDRLSSLTKQVSSLLAQNALAVLKQANTIASQNTTIQFLKSDGQNFRKETLEALNKLHRDSTWMSVELINKDFTPVLRSENSTGTVKIDLKNVISFTNVSPDSSKVGKIYNLKGLMYYPVVTTISDQRQVIGYIISWIFLKGDPKAVAQFSRLVGTGAGLYIVDSDQSLWTDMIKPIADPPFKIDRPGEMVQYKNNSGDEMIACAQPISGTDWIVAVEFSKQNVLSGMNTFVNGIVLIGIILTIIGIVATWAMSRSITRPLSLLTDAANAISTGNYSSRIPVEVNRNDELGKLAQAFNIMEQYVQQTYEELESMVDDRTAELSEEIKLRKMSEESLRQSRQRYHLMIDEVKDYAIILLDAEGKILVWNKGAERIKGYKEDEVLGKSFQLFYTKEDIENGKPQDLLKKTKQDGRSENEGWRVRKDGSKFWANVVLTSIYDGDKLVGFAKITRDITERKKLEDEVALRTQQMEKANKELEAFSYSVSHDLRTPLRAVSGYSIMLKEDYDEKLDPEGKRIIGNIIANARMMGQLIDDLLAFSRLGKKELIHSTIDMQLLATNVVNELLQNESQKDYDIRINALPPANGDMGMVKQAVMNLVSNAIKYSSKKDRPVIEIGAEDEETRTIYYVKDNGVGFDMAYAGKLFGVFQRLHSQEEFEGTGVGLALVKRIIDKHKGDIWAEAEEGAGATFYFSLPKKSNNERQQS